ncbi:MAG: hypothetical protein ABIT83_06305, partial [Massilia sp.]
SRAQIDWGNAADALPYLTEAIGENGRNFNALYLLGMANLRLAEQHKDAAGETYLPAAKRNLLLARKVNPASAETAFALYKAELSASGQPGAQAIDGAIAAWRLAHEVSTFAKAAALAHAYAGRPEEAGKALALMARNAGEPDTARWAASWRSRMAGGAVSREDLVAEMRRQAPASSVFQEWTLAGADVMQVVAQNGALEDARVFQQLFELKLAKEREDHPILDDPMKPPKRK